MSFLTRHIFPLASVRILALLVLGLSPGCTNVFPEDAFEPIPPKKVAAPSKKVWPTNPTGTTQVRKRKSKKGIAGNTSIDRRRHANESMWEIYREHFITFFCTCKFREENRAIAQASCGFKPRQTSYRSFQVDFVQIVPSETFGKLFREWSEGHQRCINRRKQRFSRRACAKLTRKDFRLMDADLYNIVPVVAEVGDARKVQWPGIIPGEKLAFGKCDFEVNRFIFEPSPGVRGDIARTYFYMDRAYPGYRILSEDLEKLLKQWDRSDPVDKWECERARRIAGLQGNENPFVEKHCN